MKKILAAAPLLGLLVGCATAPSPTGCRSADFQAEFTVEIDENTDWRMNVDCSRPFRDPAKSNLVIRNELDRAITVDLKGPTNYHPRVPARGSKTIEIDPGYYDITPSGPSLGSISDPPRYNFPGALEFQMVWTRRVPLINPGNRPEPDKEVRPTGQPSP